MASPAELATDFKNKGNVAHQKGDYRHAVYFFSRGLEINPGSPADHILYSNRSASYCLLEDFDRALADAEEVIRLNPSWPKGWSRKGTALQGMRRFDDAIAAFEKGLQLDPESDVMKKGIADAKAQKELLEPRPFDKTIKPVTQENMERVKTLNQLKPVTWHLEILKDKIWLADPPKPPFRPRSLFIIDATRIQMLHMTAHPTRDSITLDELLDFILQTCFKHGITPGMIEFSDRKLHQILRQQLDQLHIQTRTVAMAAEKQRFFEDTIRSFEEKESEQWRNNPKFAGVLRQRAQRGLMSVNGVTTFFLKHLFSAAAMFYRSKGYLYFTKGIGIKIDDGETRVALITRNNIGQYGIAMSTLKASENPMDCGTQSFLFSEVSNIPFDDADLIERHGWDIADEKFPLPMLHTPDAEIQRPSLDDLKWYEIVFKALTLFLNNTFCKPSFEMKGPDLCARCIVQTHAGKSVVILTVPPSGNTGCEMTLKEPPQPAPKENPTHQSSPPTGPPSPNSSGSSRSAGSQGQPAPAPVEGGQQRTPTNHQPAASAAPPSASPHSMPPGAHSLPPNPLPNSAVAPPPPVSMPTVVTPTNFPPATQQPQAQTVTVPAAAFSYPGAPDSGPQRWRQEFAKLVDYRNQWAQEHFTREAILHSVAQVMLYGGSSDEEHRRATERLLSEMEIQLRDAQAKLSWQSEHIKAQEALINQLQDRARELDTANQTLMREIDMKSRAEFHDNKKLLGELANKTETILRTLNTTEEDFNKLRSVFVSDATDKRERAVQRLSRPKDGAPLQRENSGIRDAAIARSELPPRPEAPRATSDGAPRPHEQSNAKVSTARRTINRTSGASPKPPNTGRAQHQQQQQQLSRERPPSPGLLRVPPSPQGPSSSQNSAGGSPNSAAPPSPSSKSSAGPPPAPSLLASVTPALHSGNTGGLSPTSTGRPPSPSFDRPMRPQQQQQQQQHAPQHTPALPPMTPNGTTPPSPSPPPPAATVHTPLASSAFQRAPPQVAPVATTPTALVAQGTGLAQTYYHYAPPTAVSPSPAIGGRATPTYGSSGVGSGATSPAFFGHASPIPMVAQPSARRPSNLQHPVAHHAAPHHSHTSLAASGAYAGASTGPPAVQFLRARSPQDLSEQEYLSDANVCF